MSKKLWLKSIANCGRKRKLTLPEAKAQKKAREEATHDTIRIYKCDKCGTYHTTSKVKKIDWSNI